MNKTIIWISIVSLLLVACKVKTSEQAVSESPETTDLIVNPDVLIEMDFLVEGMTCTGCENTINAGVSELAGVIDVKSNFQNGKTFVKYDSTLTNTGKISQAISDKGYSVKSFAVHSGEAIHSVE